MDNYTYEKARKIVVEKRKFYTHMASWIVMSLFFIFLNLFTSDFFWAVFPILGWSIGLAFHGIRVFSLTYGDDWEQKEIEKEMQKLKNRHRYQPKEDDHGDEDPLALKDLKYVRQQWNDTDFV